MSHTSHVKHYESRANLSEPCSHVTPEMEQEVVMHPAKGCVDCLAEGTRWVHLRQCLTCGEVRCCDSSEMKHATAHFNRTGHPICTSAESLEEWAWCYVDKRMLQGPDMPEAA